jgi:tRNA(Ile2) C34 agmatinyltransferase TiaS
MTAPRCTDWAELWTFQAGAESPRCDRCDEPMAAGMRPDEWRCIACEMEQEANEQE